MRRIRPEVADLEWRMERHRAELVTCEWCGARGREDLPPKPDGSEPDGEHCTNGRTGDEFNGPAHPPRIADALEKGGQPVSERSHQQCWTGERYEHICREPSGRPCVESGCAEPAGTWWGPCWCPDHDAERLDRVSANLAEIADFVAHYVAAREEGAEKDEAWTAAERAMADQPGPQP